MTRGLAWAGLGGDSLAFVLATVMRSKRCLVVVDEPDAATLLLRGLRFYLDDPSRIVEFPADDTRPYDGFSPSGWVVQQRLATLDRLSRAGHEIIVAPAAALLQRIPASEVRSAGTLLIGAGDEIERGSLLQTLTAAGYMATAKVLAPGFYAARGDVVDLWTAGSTVPHRIDFFDDEVESIRAFDPDSQRTTDETDELRVLPAREERLDDAAVSRLSRELGRVTAAMRGGVVRRRRIIEEVRAGVRFSGIEDYLPGLVPTVTPCEAFEGITAIVVHPHGVAAALRDHRRTIERRYSDLDEDDRPLIPPRERYAELEPVERFLDGGHPVLEVAAEGKSIHLGAEEISGLVVRGAELGPVASKIRGWLNDDVRVGLVARTDDRAQMLTELFEHHDIPLRGATDIMNLEPGTASLLVGDCPRGFLAPGSGWAVIPASALFGGAALRQQERRLHRLFDTSLSDVNQIKEGDLVVHRVHGIGLYKGLNRLDVPTGDRGSFAADFVQLEYRGGDILYVPVIGLADLSRYTASHSASRVQLDRLGGATWERRQGKVRDTLLKMAQGLLKVFAKRELATRAPYPDPGPQYRLFQARFPYVETDDQHAAIVAVQDDLSAESPMDRLICGDVGFGKTEVAMRAAMRVMEAGDQVAVLCPTTVLAYQHHLNFSERFADMDPPIRVEMLSRFCTPADERAIMDGLRSGDVDVVVGTTRLLGASVRFNRLGLVVIDEEHRFGVKQKTRFKKFRASVDVLSMSATPIPRTLQMAMSGLRTMSVIATPPVQRLPVRTQVARFARSRVRDAILTEMDRGGQAFFVHNRVQTIDEVAAELREWVPEARFAVAHGQMSNEALEDVLVAFMKGDFDVLVSSAIVESGVDLPNVNTMLINRADLFGLSQLYQLRGRVGRASVRGNCLLLVPEQMSRESRRRVRVVLENTQLGSGFAVASADLQLRGGGNLLGANQSGNIDAVGYDMWVELLGEAVGLARKDQDRQRMEPEVEVPSSAFIPDDMIPDTNQRLVAYRRFSNALTTSEVDAMVDDMEDQFGEVPDEVRNLAGMVRTTLECRELGIERCSWLKVRVRLDVHETSPLTPAMLRSVADQHPRRFQVVDDNGKTRVNARFTPDEARRPFRYLRWIFTQLRREI